MHVRDKDLFKYLGCFVAIVIGYMLAWTAVTLDYTQFRSFAGVHTDAATTTSGIASLASSQHSTLDDLLVKGRIKTSPLRSTPSPLSNNINATSDCVSCSNNNNSSFTNSIPNRREKEKETIINPVHEGLKGQYYKPLGEKKGSGEISTTEVQYQYFRVCRAMSWDIVVQLGQC